VSGGGARFGNYPGAAVERDFLAAMVGSHFDEEQRVWITGLKYAGGNAWDVRFRAARACQFVRLHLQSSGTGGRDYNAATSVSSTQYDMRENRQREVEVSTNGLDDYYVFLIPEFLEPDGTYTKYDGADADDHMAYLSIRGAGTVGSGVYTPTLTNVANLDASTAYECQYSRVGNVVYVSGKVDVDPTAPAAATQLGISLPIASNLGAAEDCGGVAFASGIAGQGAAIRGDAANNRAEMVWVSGDVTNQPMYFSFSYAVI